MQLSISSGIEVKDAQTYIRLINMIAQQILVNLNIKSIIEKVYKNLNELIDATVFVIGIYNEKENRLDFWGMKSENESVIIGNISVTETSTWAVHCFKEQNSIFFNNKPNDSNYHFSKTIFKIKDELRKSFIYIPLTNKHKKLGILTVQSFHENAYSEGQFNLLKGIANYLSIAIENAKAYEKIEQQKEVILKKTQLLEESQKHLEEIVINRTEEIIKQRDEIIQKNEELVRKQKEIIEQSEKMKKLSIVAEKTENAIMIMDAEGNVIWINDCFTRLYEYNYEQFIAARGGNIRKTSFNPKIIATLDKCIATKKPVIYEALNITKTGKTIWTQTSLTPVLNEKKEIVNLVAIDSDITERKNFEKKILRQTRQITESIQYASKIQNALLPSDKFLTENLNNYFILYRPKAIVSGDFYWAANHNNKFIFAIADCTGHGVPGALMSMIGISFLNEILNKYQVMNASEILCKLRELVKKSLKQKGIKGETKDGMDIGLCIIDKKINTLQFAGAYHSLLLIRENEMVEYKGDRMPIGIYKKDKDIFTNQNIVYNKGDIFYLFTDGYITQFGGCENKKFGKSNFKELLLNIKSFPMNIQRAKLYISLKEWMKKGNCEQIDDVLVAGFNLD